MTWGRQINVSLSKDRLYKITIRSTAAQELYWPDRDYPVGVDRYTIE